MSEQDPKHWLLMKLCHAKCLLHTGPRIGLKAKAKVSAVVYIVGESKEIIAVEESYKFSKNSKKPN